MKFHHRLFASVLILLLSPMAANAVPITFTFDMPAFTGGALAGSTSVLEVTVDNGRSSALNQIFLNHQITELSTDLTGPVATTSWFGSAQWITTDAVGTATLDTGATTAAYAGGSGALSSELYLGGGWFTPYNITTMSGLRGWVSTSDPIWPITSQPSQVPEPGTLALLAAGIGIMYRRRSVGGRA